MSATRVGPLRAMLAAHFGASRNRLARELGRVGLARMVTVLTLLAVTIVIPLILIFFGLGVWVGSVLPAGGAETALASILTGVSILGGAMSGTVGGAKQLTWQSYRGMPVAIWRIFAAEVVASFLEVLPIGVTLCTASLLGGIALVLPRTLVVAPMVLVETTATLLAVQLFVASLAERAVRRVRGALALMGIALLVGIVLATVAPPYVRALFTFRFDAEHIDAFLRSEPVALPWVRLLPAGFAARSVNLARAGSIGHAYLLHLAPIAFALVVGAGAAILLAREAEVAHDDDAGAIVPWTFATPFGGMLRLTLSSILTSRMGRSGLVIPLVVMAIVKSPFTPHAGQQYWAIPGAFLYVSLIGSQFQLNQFGLDGHGVKTLFLLPIDERTVLAGKAWGIAIYQAGQALFLWVLLVVMHRPTFLELVAGLLLFATLVLTSNAVGRRTSVLVPRMLPRRSVRGNATPLLLVVVGFGLSAGAAIVLGSAWTFTVRHAPALLVPVMATFTAIAAIVHRAMAPGSEVLLRERKETILAALAASE